MASDMRETNEIDHKDLGNGKLHDKHAFINPLDDTVTWFKCWKSNIEHVMMHYLQQLLIIVDPLLKSHDLRVATLEELSPEGKFFGQQHIFPKDIMLMKEGKTAETHIKIQLRKGPNKWDMFPLGEILDIFCHELAHCWGPKGHEDVFLRKWVQLRSELEKDLGGIVKVYKCDKRFKRMIKTQVKADRGLPPGELPPVPEYTRQPNAISMDAVERWEKTYQVMLQNAKTLDVKK